MEPAPLPESLLERMQVLPNGCWEWTKGLGSSGYAKIYWKLPKEGGQKPTHSECVHDGHRLVYTLAWGPILEGLVVDHSCHNLDVECQGGSTCVHRRCLNPEHLVLTTRGNNVLLGAGPAAANSRKVACNKGHVYTESTTKIETGGTRRCLICRRLLDSARYYAGKKQVKPAKRRKE